MSEYTAERVLEYIEKAERGYFNPVHMEMLRNYAALLRERESAKAEVTDEMVNKACASLGIPPSGDDPFIDANDVRAALEAVAPMLASARVPAKRDLSFCVTEYQLALDTGWNQCVDAMLAAAPKPEKE